MTGWRLGYAALPEPLVEPITRLIDQLGLVHGARVAARRRRGADRARATRSNAMLAEFRAAATFVVAGLNDAPGRLAA